MKHIQLNEKSIVLGVVQQYLFVIYDDDSDDDNGGLNRITIGQV